MKLVYACGVRKNFSIMNLLGLLIMQSKLADSNEERTALAALFPVSDTW